MTSLTSPDTLAATSQPRVVGGPGTGGSPGALAAQASPMSLASPVPQFAIADWDKGIGWVFSTPNGTFVVSREALLASGDWFDGSYDWLGIEIAHVTPRNKYSIAQIYERADLDAWVPPVLVKTFQQRIVTKRANEHVRGEDETAASALQRWITMNPSLPDGFKTWRAPSSDPRCESWGWRNEHRTDSNRMYNIMRGDWEKVAETAHCLELMEEVQRRLTAQQLADSGFKIMTRPKGELRIQSYPKAMSIYCSVFDIDGNLRDISTRRMLDDVVGLNANGMGGVLRSNFLYHGMPGLVKERKPGFREERNRIIKAVRSTAWHMRDVACSGPMAPLDAQVS